MAQFKKIFHQDLTKPRIIRHCEDVVFTGDDLSEKIGVYLYDNGEPYAGGGTVSGTVINSRGQTVPITTGEISGNLVTVTLEEAALAVPGIIGVYVKLTSGQQIATVLGAMFTAMPTETDQTIDPGTIIPSVTQLITDIQTARNSIPPEYTELLAAIAPTFSASTAYTSGSYVWQGGNLYCFTADHAAGSWTGTDATRVSLAGDLGQQVSDLRSAFLKDLGNQFPTMIVKNQYINNTTGAFETYNGWDRTELTPVDNYESLTCKSSSASNYNAFYKADKSFLIRFNVGTAENTIPIPADAAYVAFSNTATGMENLTVSVTKKIDSQITAMQGDIQTTKDDVNEIESVITKRHILHDASYDTSYNNALNNDYVWVMPNPIPQGVKSSIDIVSNLSAYAGAMTVAFLRKNANSTYTKLETVELTTIAGNDFNHVNVPDGISDDSDIYIGFYSASHGMAYSSSGETENITRFAFSDIDNAQITPSGNFTLNFSYRLIIYKPNNKNIIYVSPDGMCDYTSILDAMQNEPEGTTIIIEPGIYEQDMTECLKKRVVLIGTDRNQCIIRDSDGRYGHHALYVSCGYFENLTIEEPYISGTSQEIGVSDLGAYAVHIDTDNDYAIGKTCEFYHCTIKSDFFPAVGLGMRKNATYIFDDCELENGQIVNRGDYSDEGTLGALYFHDSNGEQGNQYIKVKDCVLKSKLAYAMCPYQVSRNPQNNRVYCDFVNNVLYSDVGKYSDTVLFRNDPFNQTTGIFSIGIGYGNSIASLNNN